MKTFGVNAKRLIKQTRAPWERVLAQFGNTKEGWEHLIDSKAVGYMATLRNLRNMVDAGISAKHVTSVAEFLSDEEQVARSKQLPFRFYSAYRHVTNKKLSIAVQDALDASVDNLPPFEGTTVIAADNSGSMQSTISGKSELRMDEVASLMCAIADRISDESHVYSFACTMKKLKLNPKDSIITNAEKINSANVGYSTHAELVFRDLISKGIKADRIIVLSDMQCYGYRGWGTGDIQSLFNEYRQKVNPKAVLHTVNLADYNQGSIASDHDPQVNLVSGFSEKIFGLLADFESGLYGTKTSAQNVPTIEYIRENFTV